MSSVKEKYNVPVLKHHVKYHAFITHCETDLGFARNLLTQIEQHHFRCIFAKRDFNPGAAVVDNIANAISSSRRTVLVISKASLRSQWCKYEMLAAIDDTNRNNRISFIPVLLHDVKDDDLPHPLRFVTYIHAGQDKDYLHKLLEALSAPDEDWEDHIPAGNVAHGLAWSYYFGYLKLLLPGMDKRIEGYKHWDMDSMCRKILLLYPSSCHCRLRRLDEDASGRIRYEGEVELLKDRAGVVGRVYKNTVYSVTSKECKKYYFVGEYVTCIRTMYEMEKSGIAGLKRDDTRLLSTKFLITVKQILDRDKDCTNMYRILFYEDTDQNDKSETLADRIIEVIEEEILAETQEQAKSFQNLNISQENIEEGYNMCDSLPTKSKVTNSVDRTSLCTGSFHVTTDKCPVMSPPTCVNKSRISEHSHPTDDTECKDDQSGRNMGEGSHSPRSIQLGKDDTECKDDQSGRNMGEGSHSPRSIQLGKEIINIF